MNAPPASGGVYLQAGLAPFIGMLERPDVTDIYVNRSGELWVETLGGTIERHDAPDIDEIALTRLARQVAAFTHQGISREHPLLSATLPDGARIQIVGQPATRGSLALAIRKHVSSDLSLADYVAAGAFESVTAATSRGRGDAHRKAAELLAAGDFERALAYAVRNRFNILVSGGTSTGKTTFLNALIREIPSEERLILIEDTPELILRHENAIGLLAVRGELGEADVTANDLVAASLRMRPDRIILGELRGDEAFAFLRAVNSGHPGSMTTIHADNPIGAVEHLVLLAQQAGTRLSREDLRAFIGKTIGMFVQLGRSGGRRSVASVEAGGPIIPSR